MGEGMRGGAGVGTVVGKQGGGGPGNWHVVEDLRYVRGSSVNVEEIPDC